MYMISSSIENILHIFHIFSFHFFLSTKTCTLFHHPSKNSSYLQRPSSSVKQNKITFSTEFFSQDIDQKVVSLSFSLSKLKIVQKVQNSFSTVKLFKKFKRFKGCKGCKLSSLSFLFYFPFLCKCIYVQIFFFFITCICTRFICRPFQHYVTIIIYI